ncbi:MAG: heme-binding protein [Bacteroidetes bacterium]|nr:heme-binding protein [Bacteroidota bacterium]
MNTFNKLTITLSTAEKMVNAAIEKANELRLSIAVTVVDESGIPKFFARMDHAPLIAIDASRKKAITAAGFGLPTGETWFGFIKDDPILREGVHDFTDFMLMGGGTPIIINDQVVGAIGVSGSHYAQDQQCAEAALDVLKIQ